ncbi:ATP-binding protein [Sneathiella limimaris]|uniref:ATP-binding protein n=1 Tax=Sneathiella limimaris TaxID=1964213 RepID=UPI00146EE925|nr:ATP-binding protein [Sneathiella limimaris]
MLENYLITAQSRLKNRIRELVFPVSLFVILACSVLVYAIVKSAETQDRVEIDTSIDLVSALLKNQENHLRDIVFDHTYWDAAVINLVLKPNKSWADDNTGVYLTDYHELSGSYVVDRDGKTTYAAEDGEAVDTQIEDRFPGISSFLNIVKSGFQPEVSESVGSVFMKDADGAVHLVVGAVLQSDYVDLSDDEGDKATALQNMLILSKAIKGPFLIELSEQFNIPELTIRNEVEEPKEKFGYLPINGSDGRILGWLEWKPTLHTEELVNSVFKNVSLILVGLLLLTLFIGYKAVKLTRELDSGINEYKAERKTLLEYERAISELGRGESLYEMSIDLAFEQIAGSAVRNLLVDQVGVWELIEEPRQMVCMSVYGQTTHAQQKGVGIPLTDFPELETVFEERRGYTTSNILEDTLLKKAAELWLGSSDPVSVHLVPVFRRGVVEGFVHFASWNPDFDWSEEKRRFARSLVNMIALILDTHAQKEVELELRRAKNMAEKANIAKTEFLANMSHELRTPLNAIIGFSDIIKQNIFGPVGSQKYVDYVEDINVSARHLLSLINEILDVAKTESGTYRIYPEPLELVSELQTCRRLVEGRFPGKSIEVTIIPDPDLKIVEVDPKSFRQVILNIMTNAAKFTKLDCKIDVTIEAAGDVFTLRIVDNGVGIPEDQIKEIYKPFRQVENAFNKRFEGTGLGLAITRALVELHGGTIEIESELDQGTTVIINLPVQCKAVSDQEELTKELPRAVDM